jgi:hypothetical protein
LGAEWSQVLIRGAGGHEEMRTALTLAYVANIQRPLSAHEG